MLQVNPCLPLRLNIFGIGIAGGSTRGEEAEGVTSIVKNLRACLYSESGHKKQVIFGRELIAHFLFRFISLRHFQKTFFELQSDARWCEVRRPENPVLCNPSLKL